MSPNPNVPSLNQNHQTIGLSKGSGRPEISYQFTLTLGYVLIQPLLPISKLQ